MTEKTEALRLADRCESLSQIADAYSAEAYEQAAAELRRLSAVEAEMLAMRRVFGEAGCTFDVAYIRRLLRAEAQRDALLEALKMIAGTAPCIDNLMSDKDIARAAIKAVEANQ